MEIVGFENQRAGRIVTFSIMKACRERKEIK